jgi:hypothetical protein
MPKLPLVLTLMLQEPSTQDIRAGSVRPVFCAGALIKRVRVYYAVACKLKVTLWPVRSHNPQLIWVGHKN